MANSVSELDDPQSTYPLYQYDSTLNTHETTLSSLASVDTFPEADKALFSKLGSSTDQPDAVPQIITTPSTIYYAQGGGQPSDTGIIQATHEASTIHHTTVSTANGIDEEHSEKVIFNVLSVRHSASSPNRILHYGYFSPSSPCPQWHPDLPIRQTINTTIRDIHSCIHTAGHLLGLAVRLVALAHPSSFPIPIKEGRAQHFPPPSSAAVEFYPTIDAKWKGAIEDMLNQLVEQNLEVVVEWWTGEEVIERCGAYVADVNDLVKEMGGEKLRIVDVQDGGVGGAYPCGGTHVQRTGRLGRIGVRKIAKGKEKGWSRLSYELKPI